MNFFGANLQGPRGLYSCPIDHQPLTQAVTLSCGHFVNEGPAQTIVQTHRICPIFSCEVTGYAPNEMLRNLASQFFQQQQVVNVESVSSLQSHSAMQINHEHRESAILRLGTFELLLGITQSIGVPGDEDRRVSDRRWEFFCSDKNSMVKKVIFATRKGEPFGEVVLQDSPIAMKECGDFFKDKKIKFKVDQSPRVCHIKGERSLRRLFKVMKERLPLGEHEAVRGVIKGSYIDWFQLDDGIIR